jgi:hypothetical protein
VWPVPCVKTDQTNPWFFTLPRREQEARALSVQGLLLSPVGRLRSQVLSLCETHNQVKTKSASIQVKVRYADLSQTATRTPTSDIEAGSDVFKLKFDGLMVER